MALPLDYASPQGRAPLHEWLVEQIRAACMDGTPRWEAYLAAQFTFDGDEYAATRYATRARTAPVPPGEWSFDDLQDVFEGWVLRELDAGGLPTGRAYLATRVSVYDPSDVDWTCPPVPLASNYPHRAQSPVRLDFNLGETC